MRYLSVCSGIEAATVAWHPLGWSPVAFAEVDAFPSAVLRHHYPSVPNLGDMTKFQDWPDADVDVLVGGTPCQSFSVAGLRKGLADPRGSLLLTYLAIADRYRPDWLVWENVPGVLSADDGRAFGSLLGGLAELGYGFAYRVLDAQYFNLAQRRARVFVVGRLGDWRRAAAVLFERESLSGHPAPRREAGQEVAGTFGSRTNNGGWRTTDLDGHGAYVPMLAAGLETTCHDYSRADGFNMIAHALRADGFDASEDGTGRGTPLTVAFSAAVAFDLGQVTNPQHCRQLKDQAGALNGNARECVASSMAVRRLTPRECERLQGFPDDYTLIPYRGKPAADGPRYKALGNSMAVPVMAWLARRIQMVEDLGLGGSDV